MYLTIVAVDWQFGGDGGGLEGKDKEPLGLEVIYCGVVRIVERFRELLVLFYVVRDWKDLSHGLLDFFRPSCCIDGSKSRR